MDNQNSLVCPVCGAYLHEWGHDWICECGTHHCSVWDDISGKQAFLSYPPNTLKRPTSNPAGIYKTFLNNEVWAGQYFEMGRHISWQIMEVTQ